MGDKYDNRDFILHATVFILFLAVVGSAGYCLYIFFRWFYIYIGGAMGVARLVAFAVGTILVALTLLAWVGNERWAFHLCATLTSGAAMTFIMAWFVSSIEQLPQYFFLGMALYVAAAVFLNIWKHQHIDLHKETNTK